MSIILKAVNIKKSFNENEEVIKGVSVEFEENTFTAIIGQSGSGKSTLLNILSGLLIPSQGDIYIEGKTINKMPDRKLAEIKRKDIGYIFQNYLLLDNLTARENIEIGACGVTYVINLEELAQILDIQDILHKFPSELSGGQQQRVAIARAVIKKPKLLFCDEATGALDEKNSVKVVELLHAVKKMFNIVVIFITHNLEIAKTADRIINMKDGRIVGDILNLTPASPSKMIW